MNLRPFTGGTQLPIFIHRFARSSGAINTALLFSLVAGLTLTGCSSNSLKSPSIATDIDYSESDETVPLWMPDSPLNTLEQALTTANPFVYTGTPIPHELSIRILELCEKEQNWESFDATVQNTHHASMRPDTYARYSLALLQGFEQLRQYNEIESWLNSPAYLQKFPMMSSEDQVALSFIRADQLKRDGQLIDSAKERLFVHDFVYDEVSRTNNLHHIWQALLATDHEKLAVAQKKKRYRELRPWINLAIIVSDFQQPAAEQALAIANWKTSWPKHPANRFIPDHKKASNKFASTLFDSVFSGAFNTTASHRLGIFLPLSGKLASAGRAVRDGILTAYFESLPGDNSLSGQQPPPTIVFYDTHQADMDSLYTRAVNEGVTGIIGPLQKQHVQALFTMPTDIPIITLNYVADGLSPTNNIVQFGLATEDEASQLALHARRSGYHQPLLLVSQKNWASRAAKAFSEAWKNSGGARPVTQLITERSQFSDEVASSLGLPQSSQRHRELENTTAQQLSFTPRRRQDIDVIILFANDQDARAINPLLAYHYAADLPIMASSYVYGANREKGYADLNGIIFSELPWLLPGTKSGHTINKRELSLLKSKTEKRLYAMGQDAFHLSSRVEQLTASPWAQWSANTGKLSIRDNRVIREAPLAQFQQGRVTTFMDSLSDKRQNN